MTTPLPPSGRTLTRDIGDVVGAARAHAPAALHDGVRRLLAGDQAQTRAVLHWLVLHLVEQAHPDGLDADDARGLLTVVTVAAGTWLPDVDPNAVVLVLGGALSVHDLDAPGAEPQALMVACALTVSHLLERLALPLDAPLVAAFAELYREQTVELP